MAHVMLVASQLDGNHVSSHSLGMVRLSSSQFASVCLGSLRLGFGFVLPRQLTMPRATVAPRRRCGVAYLHK